MFFSPFLERSGVMVFLRPMQGIAGGIGIFHSWKISNRLRRSTISIPCSNFL